MEIDETYYSKRKYNRGRVLPEQWVFRGICRETKEVFLHAVENRNSSTLTKCIKKNIYLGTTIISYQRKAYSGIEQLKGYNFQHFTVNHSQNFVEPTTGAHTQTIESLWHSYKGKQLQGGTHRPMIHSYQCEFAWRKRTEKQQYFSVILIDIN